MNSCLTLCKLFFLARDIGCMGVSSNGVYRLVMNVVASQMKKRHIQFHITQGLTGALHPEIHKHMKKEMEDF